MLEWWSIFYFKSYLSLNSIYPVGGYCGLKCVCVLGGGGGASIYVESCKVHKLSNGMQICKNLRYHPFYHDVCSSISSS